MKFLNKQWYRHSSYTYVHAHSYACTVCMQHFHTSDHSNAWGYINHVAIYLIQRIQLTTFRCNTGKLCAWFQITHKHWSNAKIFDLVVDTFWLCSYIKEPKPWSCVFSFAVKLARLNICDWANKNDPSEHLKIYCIFQLCCIIHT